MILFRISISTLSFYFVAGPDVRLVFTPGSGPGQSFLRDALQADQLLVASGRRSTGAASDGHRYADLRICCRRISPIFWSAEAFAASKRVARVGRGLATISIWNPNSVGRSRTNA